MRILLMTPLLLIALVSCTTSHGETYPPDFIQLEPSQIRGEMATLNRYMREIDDVLLDSATISSEQQERIISILARIGEVSDRLATSGAETSHLLIDENIDRFQADLDIALRDASATPPNYYALGRLSGSCNACHRQR